MINNVVLVGRLTKDPDLRYVSNGSAVATFTLAVNRNFTNQSGEREADFILCVIWRKQAENLANFAKKGSLIGVVGRIQTRSYDNQQGQRQFVTEVICDNFQLLESKGASSGRQGDFQGGNTNQGSNFNGGGNFNNQSSNNNSFEPNFDRDMNNPFSESSTIEISDDDLPF